MGVMAVDISVALTVALAVVIAMVIVTVMTVVLSVVAISTDFFFFLTEDAIPLADRITTWNILCL